MNHLYPITRNNRKYQTSMGNNMENCSYRSGQDMIVYSKPNLETERDHSKLSYGKNGVVRSVIGYLNGVSTV